MVLKINQKQKPFLMTDHDLEILNFINTFGFCERLQLEKKFNLVPSRFRDCMKRLKREELIIEEALFYKRPKTYRLSKKGAKYTDLPALHKIPLALYHHDIAVIDVALRLLDQYDESFWRSERYLKREKRAFLSKWHIADEHLIFPDGKRIAIEIELTLKDPRRLKDIFKKYALEFDIAEVWYFCPPLLLKPLQKAAHDMPFIQFFDLTRLEERNRFETKAHLS
ncbi:MAG: hypothetical protein JSS34_06030 [Proteobacteria bacterium]|nr:hypothetical protein [Pseudomonadota bacterium]